MNAQSLPNRQRIRVFTDQEFDPVGERARIYQTGDIRMGKVRKSDPLLRKRAAGVCVGAVLEEDPDKYFA